MNNPPALRFTADEAEAAFNLWGFNCGPGALAGVLQLRPEELRPHLQDFEQKRYTNPTLMFAALRALRVDYTVQTAPRGAQLPWPKLGLVRIQWGGPWMQRGVPMKARYRQTHWVGTWTAPATNTLAVFDINAVDAGGWVNLDVWEKDVAGWLMRNLVKRSDFTWSMTHAITVRAAPNSKDAP